MPTTTWRWEAPGHYQKPRRPSGRTRTIARLIAKLTPENGTPPTDEQLAALLATSVRHIRRHRDLIGRGR